MNLKNIFLKYLNEFFFVNYERNFISKKRSFKNSIDDEILVEVCNSYFYVRLIEKLIIQKKLKNITGIYTDKFIPKGHEILLVLPYFIRYVLYLLRKRKYFRLYKSIGVNKIYSLESFNYFKSLKNIFSAFIYTIKLDSVESILKIKSP